MVSASSIPIDLHQNLSEKQRGRELFPANQKEKKKKKDLLRKSLKRRKGCLGRFQSVPNFGISISHSKFQSLKAMEDMNFAGNGSLALYINIKAKAATETSPFPSEMDIAMTYKGMETEGLNTDKYDGLH